MLTILLIILVLAMLGGLPAWGWHTYGYTPSGLVLLLVIVVVVLLVRGRAP